MQGWISLHREIVEKAIWTESTPEQKVILITLLLLANHKEKEWEWKGDKYKAKPGQFVTSLQSIATKSGKDVTIKKVRTALEKFEKYGFLANESTNKNRLITIVNWEVYQSLENKKASKKAGIGQAEGRQRATNNNDNNVNNENNKESTSNQDSIESDFEKLWKLYPNKKGKSAALKSYKRSIKNGTTNKQIQDGIILYKKEIAVKGIEQSYQKHGSTFFSGECWNDDYESSQQTDTTGQSSSIPYLDDKGVYDE